MQHLQPPPHICPISTGSIWVWGYTEDCSTAPGCGRFLLIPGSGQTPWRLQTAAWLSSSSPAGPGGRVSPSEREGSSQRGQAPGRRAGGGRGPWEQRILGSPCPGSCRCGWHLMQKHMSSHKSNPTSVLMVQFCFWAHETYFTSCVVVGLVLPQPESKQTIHLTGVCGVEHHRLPFTLQNKNLRKTSLKFIIIHRLSFHKSAARYDTSYLSSLDKDLSHIDSIQLHLGQFGSCQGWDGGEDV